MTTQLNEQQINELLATKVMGWTKGNTSIEQKYNPAYDVWHDGDWNIKYGSGWNPYNNISQAFEVVEKLGKDFELEWLSQVPDWEARFYMAENSWIPRSANTPSAAICLAAVQVIQNDSETP